MQNILDKLFVSWYIIRARGAVNHLTRRETGDMQLEQVASSKIENFIESLNLPRDMANVLFETVECCQLFFEDFYMRNKYVVDDLLDFREHKIKTSNKTLDLFLKECYTKGMREAFQSTFYQSFTYDCVERVDRAINDGKTSLEQLFADFKKYPNKNVLKNVI